MYNSYIPDEEEIIAGASGSAGDLCSGREQGIIS